MQGSLDPAKEVNAAILQTHHAFKTHEQVTLEMGGGDWTENAEQLARENELLKAAGSEGAIETTASITTQEVSKMPKPNNAPQVNIQRPCYAMASTDSQTADITMYGDIVEKQPIDRWTNEPIPGQYIVESEFLNDLAQIEGVHKSPSAWTVWAAMQAFPS